MLGSRPLTQRLAIDGPKKKLNMTRSRIKLIKSDTVAAPLELSSDVFDSVTIWLEARPKNSRDVYMRIAREWSRFLGIEFCEARSGKLWKSATAQDVQRYINEACKHKAQPGRAEESSPDGCVSLSTVKHKASVLKATYDCLIAQGIVDKNPFLRACMELKRHNAGQRRPHSQMSKEALKKLLQFQTKSPEEHRDRAIFHLLFGAALRRSELCYILLSDVAESIEGTTYLRLRKTKAQAIQRLAVPDWVATEIQAFKARRRTEGAGDKDLLFVRYLERGTAPMGDKFVYRMFKYYCKIFNLGDHFSPHCARVTAITQALDQGMSHRDVQDLSRHSSVMMVERYDKRRKEIDDSASKKLSYDD